MVSQDHTIDGKKVECKLAVPKEQKTEKKPTKPKPKTSSDSIHALTEQFKQQRLDMTGHMEDASPSKQFKNLFDL